MKQSWYSIKAESDGVFDVIIYDEIGFWGITAKDFITDFRKIPADAKINLRINSPGGDVFDGLAIYNLIRAHNGEVTTIIDGLAASMASIIALAGNSVTMPENAYMMIHNPWGIALGDAADMQAMADMLDKLNGTLANIYVKKSGQEMDAIRALMDSESWLTAAEAKDLGLADTVTDPQKLAARASWKNKFENLPLPIVEDPEDIGAKNVSPQTEDPVAESPDPKPESQDPKPEAEIRAEAAKAAEERAQQIVALCAKAGVAEAAADFLAKGLSVDEVKAKLADAAKIRARAAAAAGVGLKLSPERVDAAIKAGKTVGEFADEIFDLLLARQGPEIDNKIGPDEKTRADGAAAIDPRAINKRYQEKEQKFNGRQS